VVKTGSFKLTENWAIQKKKDATEQLEHATEKSEKDKLNGNPGTKTL